MHQLIKEAGITPGYHIMDNECSELMKMNIEAAGIIMQKVPQKINRINAAERAIQTWKAHFITSLCGTDSNFPPYLWDRLAE